MFVVSTVYGIPDFEPVGVTLSWSRGFWQIMIMQAFQLTVKELHTTRTLPKLVRIYEVLYFHDDLYFPTDTCSYQNKQIQNYSNSK